MTVQRCKSAGGRWKSGGGEDYRVQRTEYGKVAVQRCKSAYGLCKGTARLARSANPTKRQGQHVVRSLPRGRAIPYPLTAIPFIVAWLRRALLG